MFEQQLTGLLASYLGKILDIQQDQLNVNVWKAWKTGLTLEDVPLRHHVSLAPGTVLVGGSIGSVQLSVPWGSLMMLTSTPKLVVNLKDVEIVLGLEEDLVGTDARERYASEKQNMLATQQLKHVAQVSLDATRTIPSGTSSSTSGGGGVVYYYAFVKHALSMVLGRLSIAIENVTVRVIDLASSGEEVVRFHMDAMETVDTALMFQFGDMMNTYKIVDRGESIVDVADGVLRHGASKNITFSGVTVSLYGSDAYLVDTDFNVKILYDIISSSSLQQQQQQVLFTMECEEFKSHVDMDRIAKLMGVMERAEWTAVRRYVAHLKPLESDDDDDKNRPSVRSFDAKGMWVFAVNSVLLHMYGPLKFATWKPEKERVHDRRRYILLYRKKLEREMDKGDALTGGLLQQHEAQQGLLSSTGERQLSLLEETMSVSDILACRSAAKTNLMRSSASSSNFELLDVKDKDGVSTMESCWMKIPTLAEMEELFRAVDFSPDSNPGESPGGFNIQLMSMARIARVECHFSSTSQALDAVVTCMDVGCGHVNNLDGNTYAMGSIQGFSVKTSRDSIIEPLKAVNDPCFQMHYNGETNGLHVDMSTGLSVRLALDDVGSIIQSLPVPSADSYSLHWIQSAIEMEQFAYYMETMQRLEKVGYFVNINLALGPTMVGLGDFEVALDSLEIRSTKESDSLLELRRIYGLMKSFISSAEARGSADVREKVLECIHVLEDRLIYKDMQVSLENARIEHNGYCILRPIRSIIGVKMNRLFGDFSHPQLLLDLSFGSLFLDMYNSVLASLQDIQSCLLPSALVDISSEKRIDETTSIRMNWPGLQIRWLDDQFEPQFSIVSGDGSIGVRASSSQPDKTISASLHEIKIFHTKGMDGIQMPMVDFNIPYIARVISIDSISLDVVQMSCSTKAHVKSFGLSLVGDEKDCRNFIKYPKHDGNVSSIEATFEEDQDLGTSVDISVSDIDVGHGTILRALIVSQLFSKPQESHQMGEKKNVSVKFLGKNLQCSFVHDDIYNGVVGLPVQYQEFSKVHPIVATISLENVRVDIHIGENMCLNGLELEQLRMGCGFLGERGASTSTIFEVPLLIGKINGKLIPLDCSSIQFGIHPYQLLLCKGVSRLIEYETSHLSDFYGLLLAKNDGESIPSEAQISPLEFSPIALKIGVLKLGIFGSLPSAGAACLQCSSIMIDMRPGSLKVSWHALELLMYPEQDAYVSESDSISDGSSVCNTGPLIHESLGTGAELSSKPSSIFLDAASIASKSFSDSSFVSKYYSIDQDNGSQWTTNDGGYRSQTGPNLLFFEKQEGYTIFEVSFESAEVMKQGALLCIQEKQASIKISPVKIRIDISNLTRASQFYHMYTKYISDHIQTEVVTKESEATDRPLWLREIEFDLQGFTILLEATETDQFCDETFESPSSKSPIIVGSQNSPRVLSSAMEIKFQSHLKFNIGNVGGKCALKTLGLSITLLSGKHGGKMKSYALLGNREICLNSSWKAKVGELGLFKSDLSLGQVSAWLDDKNVIPVVKVAMQLQKCIESFKLKCEPNNVDLGDVVAANANSSNAHATVMISLDRLWVSCGQTSLSNQKVHLLEVSINNTSFVAHYSASTLHGSVSLGFEAATSNVADGTWMSILDDTAVKCQFILPDFSNNELVNLDPVRVDIGIQEVSLTVTSDVINSLYICQLLVNNVLSGNCSLDPALYVTHHEIKNETEHILNIRIEDESGTNFDEYMLQPGAQIFPRQVQSSSYKSDCQDLMNRVPHTAMRQSKEIPLLIYFNIQGMEPELLGPLQMRTESSVSHRVNLFRQQCHLVSSTARSRIGMWTTVIRPFVKFCNNTDFDIEINYRKNKELGQKETTVVIPKQGQVWLPVSSSAGYYRFKLERNDTNLCFETSKNEDTCSWSESIYLSTEMFAENHCSHMDLACFNGESTISMSLTLEGKENCVLMAASPVFGIENCMPMPIRISNELGTTWNVEPTDSIMTHVGDFPLLLRVEPLGYCCSKSIRLESLHESAYIMWADQIAYENRESLEANFQETAPGKNEIYCQFHVSKMSSSGTVMLSIVSPVWIYNYSGVPMSLDCLLDSDLAEKMQMLLDGQDVVLDDIVPEAWVLPLSLTENSVPMSARSLRSSSHLSENSLESMDAETRASSQALVGAHGNFGDGAQTESHGSFLGLGFLSHDQDVGNLDSDSEGTWNVIGHSFSGLISPKYRNPASVRLGLPSGLNGRGFSILNHATKKFRLRFSRQKANQGSTYWSSLVVLDEQRRFESVDVPLSPLYSGIHAHNSQGSYPINITIDRQKLASRNEWIQKLMVSPKFVILNQLNSVIQYRQQGTPIDFRVLPGEFSPVQWTDIGIQKKISVRIQQAGWMWSGGFSLDHAGDIFLKLRHRDRGITRIVRADISHTSDHETKQIIIRSNPNGFAPYRLENCSLETLTIRQKGVPDQQDVLKPYCSLDYTWDEPSLSHQITIERPGGLLLGYFNLDKVGFVSSVTVRDKLAGKSAKLGIFIHAEGPLKVFTIFSQETHTVPTILEFENSKKKRNNEFELNCKLNALSVSCIHRDKERLFFILEQLALSCFSSSSRIDISGNLKAIQIDNTSMSCVYPVVFALPAPESSLTSRLRQGVEAKGGGANPFTWDFSLWRTGPDNDIICFEAAELSIRSFGVYVEQDVLNLLSELTDAKSLILTNVPKETKSTTDSASCLNIPSSRQLSGPHLLEKYYFDRISVSPVEVTISFNSSMENDWNKALLQQVLALADIEDARMWLSGVLLKNALFDRQGMYSYFSSHYKRAVLLEVFKLLGAANVLGDPLALLHHITLGFWEFLSFPAMGMIESATNLTPSGIILGFVQGTKGLLQNVLFAVSNAATKASSAAHKAILLWGYGTRNQGHYHQQVSIPFIDTMPSMNRPEESLVAATLRGLVGLVTDPIKGAEEGGLSGFLDGIRHGAFGAILIPTSAWLQMCASTALSIRKAVAGSANIGWSRPPRWINPEHGASAYDRNNSMGRWLFFQMKQNHSWMSLVQTDEYVHCSRISSERGEEYMLLTDKKILVVEACGLNWIPRLIWRSKLSMIESVTMLHKTSVMIVSNPELIKDSMMKMKEDAKTVFSVFSAEFDSEVAAQEIVAYLEQKRKAIPTCVGIYIQFDN